ncbi:MAG: multiheme c-type cytochrome [bacterium JZ-2024 1]
MKGKWVLLFGVSLWFIKASEAPKTDLPEKVKYPHNIRGGALKSTLYQPSDSCHGCHQQFFEEWNADAHGMSWRGKYFQHFYRQYLSQWGKEYDVECLKCHAPIAVEEKRFLVDADIYREGVNCDFCHTIDFKEGTTWVSAPGQWKRGPRYPSFEGSHIMFYDTTYSSSLICAPCHEWEKNGVPILDEYSSWTGSSAHAEGKQCQSCHMPTFKGSSARGGFDRPDIRAHNFPGFSDMDFLKNALELTLEARRDVENPNKVRITVKVKNKGAGHFLPAGFSWKELTLVIRLRDLQENVYWDRKEVFKKTLGDHKGNLIFTDWQAEKLLSDTRLKPDEERVYSYEVDFEELGVPSGERMFVTAQVFRTLRPKEVYQALKEGVPKPERVLGEFVEVE